MGKKSLSGVLITAAMLAVAGCSGGAATTGEAANAPADPGKVSGEIKVLTHRTDLVQNGTMDTYAAEFNKVYPKVKVTFEAITDYEGEVKIRMNTDQYGDVLMIPNAIAKDDYPKFFASLGGEKQLAGKYRFIDKSAVGGKVYGVATVGNANGFVYNKAVWKKAGITDWPTTPARFLDDLEAIKARTGAVPYYTNFKDAWPLTSPWTGILGSVSCDPQASNKLVSADPWAKGSDLTVADTLLYDIVHGKLAEKAGTNPDDIGFMPFPAQVDGKFCSVVSADYVQAVSIHSEHKEAARAWLDWFTDKSGFAQNEGSVPTLKSSALPATLKPYTDAGVRLIEVSQSETGTVNAIDKAAEIGLNTPDYRQKLVDMARGAQKGDLDDYLTDLGERWNEAAKTAGS
ncbi:ABC transporter substrate-binding protein [Streptomyces sp. NBC_00310]|uniref:ABC transporter substrate-binding protein n=1 Tax=Streptomyces sp. NBC_00310 TaxID=2903645 RepID=UPI002E221E6E